MLITEISRISNLSAAKREIVRAAAKEVKIELDSNDLATDMVAEISNTIAAMDSDEAFRAGGWYFEAHAFACYLSATFNVSVEIAAGVISAVSPRMPWQRNKKVAKHILETYGQYANLSDIDAAKQIGMALSANVAMAVRIARTNDFNNPLSISDILTGTKRRSFYNNIVAPAKGDSVTVDTWMMVAFCNVTGTDKKTAEKFVRQNETALGGTGVGYILIADAVREVAKAMGIAPHAIQAQYWVQVSGDFNGGRTDIS